MKILRLKQHLKYSDCTKIQSFQSYTFTDFVLPLCTKEKESSKIILDLNTLCGVSLLNGCNIPYILKVILLACLISVEYIQILYNQTSCVCFPGKSSIFFFILTVCITFLPSKTKVKMHPLLLCK